MAGTPLTDSIEALTTYANQTTGASDTNLSDAVYTLVQGYGGGGESPFIIEEVLVGENNVTNMAQAHEYFFQEAAIENYLLLKDAPDTYNQLVNMIDFSNGSNVNGAAGRYRNGGIAYSAVLSSYDGVLVAGTTYYKVYLK